MSTLVNCEYHICAYQWLLLPQPINCNYLIYILFQDIHTFLDSYRDKSFSMSYPISEFYASLTYDGIWSLALALNASQLPLMDKYNTTLHEFNYESPYMTTVFMEQMNKLAFEGMTVRHKLFFYVQ